MLSKYYLIFFNVTFTVCHFSMYTFTNNWQQFYKLFAQRVSAFQHANTPKRVEQITYKCCQLLVKVYIDITLLYGEPVRALVVR